METSFHKRMTIDLHNDELEAMGQIIRLASERLASAPATPLRGIPMERQAGLVGIELYRVNTMLEKLAGVLGVDISPTADPDPDKDGISVFSGIVAIDPSQSPDDVVNAIMEQIKRAGAGATAKKP